MFRAFVNKCICKTIVNKTLWVLSLSIQGWLQGEAEGKSRVPFGRKWGSSVSAALHGVHPGENAGWRGQNVPLGGYLSGGGFQVGVGGAGESLRAWWTFCAICSFWENMGLLVLVAAVVPAKSDSPSFPSSVPVPCAVISPLRASSRTHLVLST